MAKNKYRAFCAECQYTCFPGEGEVKKESGEWVTRHIKCPDVEEIQRKRREAIEQGRDMQKLRAEVLADPKCTAWLSGQKKYV